MAVDYNRREFVGFLGAGAALSLVGLPGFALAQERVDVAALMEPSPLGEKTLGDPNAPVTVIEYASMTCSHCQNFHETTFDAFKAKYIDTGKVFFVFREFPLDPLAAGAIMLARCAPNDRYFEMVDLLFNKQREWAFVDDPVSALLDLSKQTGFTEDTFRACLTNQELLDGVNVVRDRAAEKFGVNATPTFFINGEKHAGALTLEQMDQILQPLLAG
jgi:protein-disulfide isomerase